LRAPVRIAASTTIRTTAPIAIKTIAIVLIVKSFL
jgi:hypothetical protein